MYQYDSKSKTQPEKSNTLTANKNSVQAEIKMPVQTKSLFSFLGQGGRLPAAQMRKINADNDPALEQEGEDEDNAISLIGGDNRTPIQMKTTVKNYTTEYKFRSTKNGKMCSETVGYDMTANLDPADPINGTAPGAVHQDLMHSLQAWHPRESFIRGHLLNDNLGGLGLPANLFPITSSANGLHKDNVESFVKQKVGRGEPCEYRVWISNPGGTSARTAAINSDSPSANINCELYDWNPATPHGGTRGRLLMKKTIHSPVRSTRALKPVLPPAPATKRHGPARAYGSGARGIVARGIVARGIVARGIVARGIVARGIVARGIVARGAGARSTMKRPTQGGVAEHASTDAAYSGASHFHPVPAGFGSLGSGVGSYMAPPIPPSSSFHKAPRVGVDHRLRLPFSKFIYVDMKTGKELTHVF